MPYEEVYFQRMNDEDEDCDDLEFSSDAKK